MASEGYSPRARRLLFVLLTLVLVAVLLEVVGSLAYRFALPEMERHAVELALGMRKGGGNAVARYRPHPYLNYVGNPEFELEDGSRLYHWIGFRDPGFDPLRKRDGVFRIVALGGSTTYGQFTDDVKQVWPHLVGRGLTETLGHEVEVINAALPNYTTNEMIGMASFWLPEFHPDLVLVHTGLNDAFSAAYADEGGPDARNFRHAWTYQELPAALTGIMRASRLFRLLGVGLLRDQGARAGDMTSSIQYSLPSGEEMEQHFAAATGKYYRRNLETIALLARRTGAQPVFVEMPVNPNFEVGDNEYFKSLSRAVVRNNRIMREVGKQYDIPIVPLYEQMRDPTSFVDAAHTNPQGMMQKAQGVYDAVLPLVQERLAG